MVIFNSLRKLGDVILVEPLCHYLPVTGYAGEYAELFANHPSIKILNGNSYYNNTLNVTALILDYYSCEYSISLQQYLCNCLGFNYKGHPPHIYIRGDKEYPLGGTAIIWHTDDDNRRWEYYKYIVDKLPQPVYAIDLLQYPGYGIPVVNETFGNLANLFRCVKVVIGNDTGVMHLAAASNAKCLVISNNKPNVVYREYPNVTWIGHKMDLRLLRPSAVLGRLKSILPSSQNIIDADYIPKRIALVTIEYKQGCVWGESLITDYLAIEFRKIGWKVDIYDFYNYEDIKQHNYDYVLSVGFWKDIRRLAGKSITAFWHFNMYDGFFTKRFQRFEDIGNMGYDIVFTNSRRLLKEKTNYPVRLLDFAVTKEFCRLTSITPEYNADVGHVGNNAPCYKTSKRSDDYLLPAIKHDFKLYGTNWQQHPQLSKYYHGKLPIGHLGKFYNSVKIALSYMGPSQADWDMINNRVWEILACTHDEVGFLICDDVKAISKTFGKMVVTSNGGKDLAEKIDYWLKQDRSHLEREVAWVQDETYAKRVKQIIKELCDYENKK